MPRQRSYTTKSSAYEKEDLPTWKLSSGDVNMMLALYAQGYSSVQIAEAFNISRQAVRYHLVKNKVKARTLKMYFSKE